MDIVVKFCRTQVHYNHSVIVDCFTYDSFILIMYY